MVLDVSVPPVMAVAAALTVMHTFAAAGAGHGAAEATPLKSLSAFSTATTDAASVMATAKAMLLSTPPMVRMRSSLALVAEKSKAAGAAVPVMDAAVAATTRVAHARVAPVEWVVQPAPKSVHAAQLPAAPAVKV